jgi:DNA invertase Pin-like site-specific DNA recombinase
LGVVVIYAKGPDGNPLWDYAVRRGWEENVRVVTGLDALIRLVRAGRVEVVLASSLIGLGHSSSQLVAVLKEFISRRIVVIIPGRINTSVSPEVFLRTLDAVEEFKHAATVEAINEGLAAAKARGVSLGRPEIVNRYREDVAKLQARGLSGRAIGRELSISNASVFKIIGQLEAA